MTPRGTDWSLAGRVRRELALGAAQLDRGDELTATLDCTGGFSSRQRWRGVRLGRLLDEAGVEPGALPSTVLSSFSAAGRGRRTGRR